jgi:hypothetical protein
VLAVWEKEQSQFIWSTPSLSSASGWTKVLEFTQKKLTSVRIYFKKCVPICWLIWLGQGILSVQALRLASLPPAHQSGPSGKAKCHSLTKNGNVRRLTNERISLHGHPRAILTRPASCQSATHGEGAKPVYLVVVFSFLKCCQSAKQTKQQKKKSSEKNSFLSVSFVSEHEKVSFEVFLTSCKTIRSKTYVNYSGSVLSVLPGKKPPSLQNNTMQQQLIQAHSAAAVPKIEGGGKQKRRSIFVMEPQNAYKRILPPPSRKWMEEEENKNAGPFSLWSRKTHTSAFRRRRP